MDEGDSGKPGTGAPDTSTPYVRPDRVVEDAIAVGVQAFEVLAARLLTGDPLPQRSYGDEDESAKLDVALDETFPTSDAPSNTQPGKGSDPAPSSGFDEEAERERMAAKE